jgi:phosphinothricin acetyltransferase
MRPINRLASADDAEQIALIYSPVVERTAISFEVDPPTTAEMCQRIETTLRSHPWIVNERNGVVTGYAYGSQHRVRAAYQWSADVSVYVHQDHRGRGVGSALYESLLRLLRAQGFHTLYAGITLPNAASVGLHESVGFRPLCTYRGVGFKLGNWHDVGWWELSLRPAVGVPTAPRLLAALEVAEIEGAMAAGVALLRA